MTSELELGGAGTALVTPFRADGEVDLEAFRALVQRQVAAGISLLVPCGTTGESATLSDDEREVLVRVCVAEARGGARVVAGTGSNDTRPAVASARAAAE
jgi:4-hydroxy-tetrahydrodipicolinate synthase